MNKQDINVAIGDMMVEATAGSLRVKTREEGGAIKLVGLNLVLFAQAYCGLAESDQKQVDEDLAMMLLACDYNSNANALLRGFHDLIAECRDHGGQGGICEGRAATLSVIADELAIQFNSTCDVDAFSCNQ